MARRNHASEPRQPGLQDPPPSEAHEPHENAPRLAALRGRGAHRFDPIRFGYIEALARHAAALGGEVRSTLDGRLSRALAAYGAQFDQASAEAKHALSVHVRQFPHAAEALHRLHAEADFRGLHRLIAQLEAQTRCGRLGELVRHIDTHPPAPPDGGAIGATAAPTSSTDAPPAELKALRLFRHTWARLGVDQQLSRSLAKAPENPGPLNSHLLMLRSLQLMQNISPAYLNHFMVHVNTLLWLDTAGLGAASAPNETARREGDKTRKTGRGK